MDAEACSPSGRCVIFYHAATSKYNDIYASALAPEFELAGHTYRTATPAFCLPIKDYTFPRGSVSVTIYVATYVLAATCMISTFVMCGRAV